MFRHLSVRLGTLFKRDRMDCGCAGSRRVACLMPARRAASMDPMAALRAQ